MSKTKSKNTSNHFHPTRTQTKSNQLAVHIELSTVHEDSSPDDNKKQPFQNDAAMHSQTSYGLGNQSDPNRDVDFIDMESGVEQDKSIGEVQTSDRPMFMSRRAANLALAEKKEEERAFKRQI